MTQDVDILSLTYLLFVKSRLGLDRVFSEFILLEVLLHHVQFHVKCFKVVSLGLLIPYTLLCHWVEIFITW